MPNGANVSQIVPVCMPRVGCSCQVPLLETHSALFTTCIYVLLVEGALPLSGLVKRYYKSVVFLSHRSWVDCPVRRLRS